MAPNSTRSLFKNPALRRRLSFSLKLLLSATALFFVFRKVDIQKAIQPIFQVIPSYLIVAFLVFNLSKIAAAFRFRDYLKALEIQINNLYSIELFYLGMFYNLFLPGSISGDGYKVYLLKQQFSVKAKQLIGVTLLDRLSGLALLLILAGGFLLFSSFSSGLPYFDVAVVILIVAVLPVFYLFNKLLFSQLISAFGVTTFWSFWVQVGQVLTAALLLASIGVETYYLDYLTLFMVSSVVAVLPFTIGGVGARELVFLYGFQYLEIQQETAITFTLLFFLVTALSSLLGLFVSIKKDN
ncbi:lysylphosphatidylglycerol synthase transmembrane domain-containing protein [Tunicatimonas pelagia]|uniref:lysylphosphatidylglycerol synthase transmembrane domain-containing protein n=1 Tax=Tunicatimonas pelagia TaxID=931531 RepID=UPI0026671E83|nr:lysylphosphatidylglycerol synthase transmembrane domain-containing protein [Tunicatimonas pelagia]WKN44458.1 lysylphosphatidylglycerol synthase transmembrane domain-containing protein [Tunicatimonas pelagia]